MADDEDLELDPAKLIERAVRRKRERQIVWAALLLAAMFFG